MARRQLPIHESMQRPGRGILESLAERLGAVPDEGGELGTASEESVEAVADIAAEPEPVAEESDFTPTVDQNAGSDKDNSIRTSTLPFRPGAAPASCSIDSRIVEAKGKQALYVRLPLAMHEFLEDLSHVLGKQNRDASMANLVAQAILDKYPDALDRREDA